MATKNSKAGKNHASTAGGSRKKSGVIELKAEIVPPDDEQHEEVEAVAETTATVHALPYRPSAARWQEEDDDELVFGDGEYLGLLNDLASVENRVTISIYMRSPASRQMTRLFAADPMEFPTLADLCDHCRREYGPGFYQLRVYADGRKGTKHLKNFEVIESESQRAQRLSATLGRGNNTGPVSEIVDQALQQANRQQDTLMQFVAQIQDRAFKPAAEKKADWLDNAIKLIAAAAPFAPLLLKMLPQRADPLEQLKNTAILLRELKDDSSDAGELGMTGLLGKALDKLGPAIAHAAMNQPQQKQAPAAQQQLQPALTPPYEKQQTIGDIAVLHADDKQKQSDIFAKLTTILGMCVAGAAKEADPALYAEMLMDQLEDAEIDELARHLPNPQLLTVLASLEPRIVDHQQWFAEWLQHIEAIFTDPDDQDGESTNGTDSAIPPNTGGDDQGKNDANSDNGDQRSGTDR